MRFLSLTARVFAFAVVCASPPWENMSQTDIESWKGLGYNSEQARELLDNGIGLKSAASWKDAGLVGWKSIKGWRGNGMSPTVAGTWQSAGFTYPDAGDWAEKKFEPSEAKEWRDAGKSLDEAADARGQGLMPIKASTKPAE